MTGSGSLDKAQGESVLVALEHVESLAKAEVTKNIHGEVVTPVAHVSRLRPTLGFDGAVGDANLLAKGADVSDNIPLHLLHGTLGKGMG